MKTLDLMLSRSVGPFVDKGRVKSLRAAEKGSSLIAVLLIILLITVLGVMASRQGLTALSLSTNSQIRQLAMQNSDKVVNQFINLNQSPASMGVMLGLTGILGAAVSNSAINPLQEYVFCVRPMQTQLFGMALNSAVIAGSSSGSPQFISGNNNGFCDLTQDFASGRSTVVTQVAVTIPADASSTLCSGCPQGTDLGGNSALPSSLISAQRIRVTATSMVPSLSSTSVSTVQSSCLGSGSTAGKISDDTDPSLQGQQTVTDCLALNGMPAETQVQEFNQTNVLTSVSSPVPTP